MTEAALDPVVKVLGPVLTLIERIERDLGGARVRFVVLHTQDWIQVQSVLMRARQDDGLREGRILCAGLWWVRAPERHVCPGAAVLCDHMHMFLGVVPIQLDPTIGC